MCESHRSGPSFDRDAPNAAGVYSRRHATLHEARAKHGLRPLAVRPPLSALACRDRLPVPLTPLIGRALEVEAGARYLLESGVRLLTLTGPGGTGKTRLALAIAAAVARHFTAGACMVDLAPLVDPALVLDAVAAALGVKAWERSSGLIPLSDPEDQPLLLVLDNFEQVRDAAPDVVALLAAYPTLKVLVTSRVALRVRGEQLLIVPPLGLPDAARIADSNALAGSPAVALFVDRARAARPDFALTAHNSPVVAAICAHLGGLPLAIELAAARIAVLSPAALLALLRGASGRGKGLATLAGGVADLPPRQQSLRQTIDWSYALLVAEERQVFARLAPFVGGGTLEAFEAVAGDPAVDVLGALEGLLHASLVARADRAGDEPRFTMLEVLREYAAERLAASGEEATVRGRHAAHYLALAAAAGPAIKGTEQGAWLARLAAEHDNLRAALEWALGAGEHALSQQLGAALAWYWYVSGHYGEGRRWLERLTAVEDGPLVLRARVRQGLARILHAQGDLAGAAARYAESRTLAAAAGDRHGEAAALNGLGLVAYDRGDYADSSATLTACLALRRELGDRHGGAVALNSLGNVAKNRGEWSAAVALYEEALADFLALRDERGMSVTLHNLGHLAWLAGEPTRAAAPLEESLRLARRLGDTRCTAWSLHYLGLLAAEAGDAPLATERQGESLALRRELADRLGVAECLEGFGFLAAVRRQGVRAARLFGAAETARADAGVTLPPIQRGRYDRALAASRKGLEEAAWEAARAAGRALPVERAIAEALDSGPEGPVGGGPPSGLAARAAAVGLSAREGEVAALVTGGLTNHQIADRLSIGKRTVDTHITNLLRKLNLTTRAQIAVWATQANGVPDER